MTILARLQTATGPDRALDAAIAVHLGWEQRDDWWHSPDGISTLTQCPYFTGSIDAAASLFSGGYVLDCRRIPPVVHLAGRTVGHAGATPALALCIAWAAENTDVK